MLSPRAQPAQEVNSKRKKNAADAAARTAAAAFGAWTQLNVEMFVLQLVEPFRVFARGMCVPTAVVDVAGAAAKTNLLLVPSPLASARLRSLSNLAVGQSNQNIRSVAKRLRMD